MIATIAKDDKFQTVGFRVISEQHNVILKWGVEPIDSMYWVKQVDCKKYETEIIKVIVLTERLEQLKKFTSEWFEIAKETPRVKIDGGVNFSTIDAKRQRVEMEIENIIKRII